MEALSEQATAVNRRDSDDDETAFPLTSEEPQLPGVSSGLRSYDEETFWRSSPLATNNPTLPLPMPRSYLRRSTLSMEPFESTTRDGDSSVTPFSPAGDGSEQNKNENNNVQSWVDSAFNNTTNSSATSIFHHQNNNSNPLEGPFHSEQATSSKGLTGSRQRHGPPPGPSTGSSNAAPNKTMDVLAAIFFCVAATWLIIATLYACLVYMYLRLRARQRLDRIYEPDFGRVRFCGVSITLPLACLLRRYVRHLHGRAERRSRGVGGFSQAAQLSTFVTRQERRLAMEILLVQNNNSQPSTKGLAPSGSMQDLACSGSKILDPEKPDDEEVVTSRSTTPEELPTEDEDDDEEGDDEDEEDDDLEAGDDEDDLSFDQEVVVMGCDTLSTTGPLCSICLGDYADDPDILQSKTCPHMFHRECILDWLERQENTDCPCCRVPMVEEQDVCKTVQRMRKDKRKRQKQERRRRKRNRNANQRNSNATNEQRAAAEETANDADTLNDESVYNQSVSVQSPLSAPLADNAAIANSRLLHFGEAADASQSSSVRVVGVAPSAPSPSSQEEDTSMHDENASTAEPDTPSSGAVAAEEAVETIEDACPAEEASEDVQDKAATAVAELTLPSFEGEEEEVLFVAATGSTTPSSTNTAETFGNDTTSTADLLACPLSSAVSQEGTSTTRQEDVSTTMATSPSSTVTESTTNSSSSSSDGDVPSLSSPPPGPSAGSGPREV